MYQAYFLCSWWLCSGLCMVVSSEPSVTAWIVTPERDQKIGGRVEMRCVATNLEEDHFVEWRTENLTLRWGDTTVGGNDPRFMFVTKQTGMMQITQELSITDLQLSDNDEYFCNVNYRLPRGGNSIVATDQVNLTVFYFPNESFPICSPDGPITVGIGTLLNLQCSSDNGNSAVMMNLFQISSAPPYKWKELNAKGTIVQYLDMTVDINTNNSYFLCMISSRIFPNMNSSCYIGPIDAKCNRTVSSLMPPTPSQPHQANATLIAGASSGVAAGLLLIVILFLICRKRVPCGTKHTSSRSNKDLNSNPIISAYAAGQSCVYENAGRELSDDTQDYKQEPYHEQSQVRIGERPEPEAGVLYTRPSPPAKQTPTKYTPPVYAKPNKPQAPVDAGNGQYNEQKYNNPVFDFADSDNSTTPLGEITSVALKPTPMVTPFTKVPRKPQPYKPKDQRASDPRYGIAYHQGRGESTRPKSTPSLPSTDAHILTASENPCAEPSSPDGMTMYTEVSVPQIKTSTDRDTPSLPDHLVYADLNLEPDSSEDVGQPVISEEPVAVYARVMKNRPNSEETM